MMSADLDYSRKWPTMYAIAMGIFLSTVDSSIVNVALPTLVRKLETEFSVIQWVVLGYLLTVTTLMLGIGRLGDMVGKKKLYTAGFIVFTCGSVLCGLSPSVHWLIAFRIFKAVGAAMIMSLGMAIVTEAFPPNERGKALGICASVVSVGIAVGPSLGGLILSQLSWRWIFFVNLPIGIVGTLMVVHFVQESRPAPGQRFDFAGAVTLFISLLGLLLGLTIGQQSGFLQLRVYVLLVVWLVFLVGFMIIELRVRQPMIDLRLFKNEVFSINLTNAFIAFVGVAGTIILLPFYLENILRYSTLAMGIMLCIVPAAMGIVAPLAGALSDRLGTSRIATFGLFIVLASYYGASTLDQDTTTWGYLLRLAPLGLGMGIFQSPNNSAIMGSIPRHHLGVASGFTAVARTLGQTVGISVLGAFWTARTFHYVGANLSGGVTAAPVEQQVAGLQDTFWMVFFLVVLAILLSFWKLTFYRSQRQPSAGVDSRTETG